MRKTFFNLDAERQNKLLDCCLREFTEKGFDRASTNAVVRKAGVSKGSFFKYFGSKESVYLYLVKLVLAELGAEQGQAVPFASTDIVGRAEELFARHMEYGRRFPLRYRFALRALLDVRSSVFTKTAAIRKEVSRRASPGLYDGVNWTRYRYPREDVLDFLRCLDLGLRQDAMQSLRSDTDLGAFEAYVAQRLALARRILSSGLYAAVPREDKHENRDE